jgi:hypothetical protein
MYMNVSLFYPMPYNVLRVCEPATRARRLRFCLSATAVTKLQVAEGTFAALQQQAGAALALHSYPKQAP